MWDVCTNTSTTGQRKNKQGPRVQAESNGLKRMSQNLTTLLDLCNNVSRGICIKNVSQRDEEPRPRRGGTHNTASQRRNTKQHDKGKDGSKLREVSTDSRAHGVFSTREQNAAACVAASQRHAVTDQQPNVHGWAESPKTARVTLKITKHEIPRKSSRTRAETNKER